MKFKTEKELFIEFLMKHGIYTNKAKSLIKTSLMENAPLVNVLRYIGEFSYYYEWQDFYYRNTKEFKMFIRFIKENNILNKFLNNIKYQNKTFNSFDFINTFVWDDTSEGFHFWARLSNKWNFILDSLKK